MQQQDKTAPQDPEGRERALGRSGGKDGDFRVGIIIIVFVVAFDLNLIVVGGGLCLQRPLGDQHDRVR